MTMERIVEQLGQLSVSDAFALLRKGLAVHIASAPEEEGVLPVRGAWKDREGNIHYDRSAFYLHPKLAIEVARAFGQDCVFGLYPNSFGNGRVYLLKDLIRYRVLALHHTGGYVSDGDHLLVACLGDDLPFEAEVLGWVPADLVLTFACTHTHAHTRKQAGSAEPVSTEPAPSEPALSEPVSTSETPKLA